MQELSMNLLDIAQNSVAAGSTLTQITIAIDTAAKRLTPHHRRQRQGDG